MAKMVILIACGLLIGGILRTIRQYKHFSYTPMVLLAGFLTAWFKLDNFTVLHEAYWGFVNMNPEGLLAILIPIVLFEESFSIDYHYMKAIWI